jgi:hypothetical protein
MRRYLRSLFCVIALILCCFILSSVSNAEKNYISATEAHKFIGETKTVCGTVASTFYSVRSKGQPTFLNLDQPYPNQIFTVVIWGSDRNKFKNPPEVFFKDKRICVTGTIETYRGKPQIIVRDPSQIVIKKD